MTNAQAFEPDWISPPGETIQDLLHQRDSSAAWLATALKRPKPEVDDLLSGKATITPVLAEQLGEVLGASARFWMARDAQYQAAATAIKVVEDEWLTLAPIADLVRLRWIERARTAPDKIAALLKFFDLSSVLSWQRQYKTVLDNYAFSTSLAYQSNPVSVSVWLHQGERLADEIECAPWNPEAFRQMLGQLRTLTRQKDPQIFIPQLQRLCAQCGVALIVLPPVSGCRASGATRLVSDHKAVILMSARHLSDDHFWFTFFHEAGHLLLHASNELFLDFGDAFNDVDDPQVEREANAFSAEVLVPAHQRERLLTETRTQKDVIRLAAALGVSAGIIVGQLQHMGQLKPNQFNKLKRRYKWHESALLLN